jgi:hypothetical protein
MADIDDLRKPDEDFDFDDEMPVDDFDIDVDDSTGSARFLGMTPVERMFIAIFLFMNVLVLGLALLLATGRLAF